MRSRKTSRRTFSVLLLVWLNLAMLPCAMAVGAGPDHQDGPPGQAQTKASHHAHQVATDTPGSAALQLDCCGLDQVDFGDISQKFEKKDSDNPGLIVAYDYSVLRPPAVRRVWKPSDPPDLTSGSPRLHVIICVYLD